MDKNGRSFVNVATMAATATCLAGCQAMTCGLNNPAGPDAYSVSILGDAHFDAEPESVYHSHYDESNRWAEIQHKEFRRNGEMWRERCRELLASSARLAHEKETLFILQIGDIIQGDCDDVPTHKKMLDDCIKMLRAPYPAGLPFLTVVGNHDFRGKGAWEAYFQFAEPFMSREIGKEVKYPVFSFRQGKDLWVFCNFETRDLDQISDIIDADPAARHVFLVTHGPFTAFERDDSYRWRLGGSRECEASRPRLYETLSRRHAIVLSGHTHTTNFYRHENEFGGFCEFTANSVWANQELATSEPIQDKAADYGMIGLAKYKPGEPVDLIHEIDFFKPGLKEYFFNNGAGHYRLDVSNEAVTMEFYPGAATEPARKFRLK